MGRYVYDSDKVNETLSQLTTAKGKLSSTSSEFSSALSEIVTASKGYLEIDTSTLPAIPDSVETSIEELSKMIADKQEEIEDYNNSPRWEKLFASISMGATKFLEGIGTAGEQLVDAGATIVGWGAGAIDIFAGTNYQDGVADFIEKDHVGDFFADQYENGALKWVNDKSWFSHTSTAANVFKGVGVATGYVGVAFLTGGAGAAATGGSFAAGGSAAMGSLGVNATIAGLGGLGSGTQSGLQQGMTFGDASFQGVKQGAIQAGTVFVAGKVAQKFAKPKTTTELSVVDDVPKLPNNTANTPRLPGNTTQTPRLPGEVTVETGVMKDSAGNVFKTTKNVAFKATDNPDDVVANALGISNKTGSIPKGSNVAEILDESGNVIGHTNIKVVEPTSKVTNATFMKDGKMYTTSTGHTFRDSAQIFKEGLQNKFSSATQSLKNTGSAALSTTKNMASNLGSGLKTVGSATLNGGKTAIAAVASSPAAQGNLVASSINQSIAQNANEQFKSSVDPSNHVVLNSDMPEGIAFVKEGPFDNNNQDQNNQDQNNQDGDSNNQGGNSGNDNNPGPSGNTGNTGGGSSIQARVDNPTPSNPEPDKIDNPSTIDSSIKNPENNNPTEKPSETPEVPDSSDTNNSQTGNENNGMSGDISTGEEPVPETPSTGNNSGNTGNTGNGGSTGSVIGGISNGNSNTNSGYINGGSNNYGSNNSYGNGYGQSGELSYENKPGTEISGDESGLTNIGESDSGSTLDVISIDKEGGAASVSKGSNDGGAVIPTILGVGAAAGAGVAGIHYIKKKNDNQDDEYYEDDSNDNNQNMYLENYNDSNSQDTDYTQDEVVAAPQKYKAGTMNQLALDDGTNININEDNSIIAPQKEELE